MRRARRGDDPADPGSHGGEPWESFPEHARQDNRRGRPAWDDPPTPPPWAGKVEYHDAVVAQLHDPWEDDEPSTRPRQERRRPSTDIELKPPAEVEELRPPEQAGGGFLKKFGGPALWVFADQAVCSLSTFALAILVGRSVGEEAFGAFSIAFLVFTFLVGLSRSTVTDPMVVIYSKEDAAAQNVAVPKAIGLATLLGMAGALPTLLTGLFLGTSSVIGASLISLALVLPGLLQQDAWRFVFFMTGRPRPVAINDTIRTVLMFALVVWLHSNSVINSATMILVWGASAYIASALGAVQARRPAAFRGCLEWLGGHWKLSAQFGADFTISQGSFNGTNVALGPISSLATVGALNASRSLLGPLSMLFGGSTAMVLPAMSARSHRTLIGLAAAVSGLLSAVAAGWVLCLMMIPRSWGVALLDRNWAGAEATIPATGWAVIMVGAAVGPNLALKAREESARLLRITLVQAPLMALLGLSGAWVGGAVGASTGFAIAQSIGAALTWKVFVDVEREAVL
ncbi:hypothetical protein [Austwickia chelonae]|uniref:hypothetical protein n=1 Tax=Austwickia chelonae TaxID=100225 RepID=UPI000E231A04|nr:hypothetical protein [Austwickia chelonae]